MKPLALVLLIITVSCSDKSGSQQQGSDGTYVGVLDTEPGNSNGHNPVAANNEIPQEPHADEEEAAPIEAPANQYKLDASSTSVAAYFKWENGALVATTSDQAWHFNVRRTQFQTNSGTSGTLNFGVFETVAPDYASVTNCSVGTLSYDEMLPASGAPGSQPYSGNALLNDWFNYDMTTHVVSSKKQVYLISNGSTCYKFQILSYESGLYKVLADTVAMVPPPPAPVVYEQSINATSSTDTVYLKLMDGQLATATATDSWLLAVKRTQFQTNSGTSGTGSWGIYNSDSTDFAALTSCSGLTFAPDEMLPASGAPGSQPYSGSAVLNAWFNYDPTTHVVSSKQHVYALSDGTSCLKFQILTYSSGNYTVKVSQL